MAKSTTLDIFRAGLAADETLAPAQRCLAMVVVTAITNGDAQLTQTQAYKTLGITRHVFRQRMLRGNYHLNPIPQPGGLPPKYHASEIGELLAFDTKTATPQR